MAQNLISATFPEAKATEVQQNLMAAKAKIILLLGVQPKMSPHINELTANIRKTYTTVGSDTLVAALESVYHCETNKDKVAGVVVTADEMDVFFKNKCKKEPVK